MANVLALIHPLSFPRRARVEQFGSPVPIRDCGGIGRLQNGSSKETPGEPGRFPSLLIH